VVDGPLGSAWISGRPCARTAISRLLRFDRWRWGLCTITLSLFCFLQRIEIAASRFRDNRPRPGLIARRRAEQLCSSVSGRTYGDVPRLLKASACSESEWRMGSGANRRSLKYGQSLLLFRPYLDLAVPLPAADRGVAERIGEFRRSQNQFPGSASNSATLGRGQTIIQQLWIATVLQASGGDSCA